MTLELSEAATSTAAILMSAGFFLSAIGRDRDRPNRLVVLASPHSGSAC
jgi:hypothetical protein